METERMTIETKTVLCLNFYNELINRLSDKYELMASSNQHATLPVLESLDDILNYNTRFYSSYLIPKGTADQISYYGKPIGSFRFSDHWNWYSNVNKCSDLKEIQCFSVDIPWPRQRMGYGRPSKPRFATQVAFYGKDLKYHVIFGEKFNRKTKEWEFVTTSVDEVIENLEVAA